MRWLLRTAPPIVAVLVPKCPLCLLPIAALLGIRIPPSFALDAAFAMLIGLSFFALQRFRIVAACCAVLAIGGRLTASPVLVGIGAAVMLGCALLSCGGGSCRFHSR